MTFIQAAYSDADSIVAHGVRELNLLMEDSSVNEIMINRFDRIFVEKKGKIEEAAFTLESPEDVKTFAMMIIKLCGKEEEARINPVIDGALADGSRITVVFPPVSIEGPSISIRKFNKDMLTIEEMGKMGQITPQMVTFLDAIVQVRANIVLSGSTSSGKTTFLNALSAHIREGERIVTIEDTPELQLRHRNVVRLVIDGVNERTKEEVTARSLVKSSLRMRPDRIIMGEIRGLEAFDFLQAINTGHDGSMATIHANNPREAFNRLENMAMMANSTLSVKFIRQQITSALDLVIHLGRSETGKRGVTNITEIVGMEGETVVSQDLFALKAGTTLDNRVYEWKSTSSRSPKVQKALMAANVRAQ